MGRTYFAASFNQESRLAAEEMAKEAGYRLDSHAPCAMRIYGPIDIAALEWALHIVVQRHAALRTSFVHNPAYSAADRHLYLGLYGHVGVLQPGMYRQAIASDVYVPIAQYHLPPGNDEWIGLEHWADAAFAELRTKHSPAPIRATLIRRSVGEAILVVIMPHMIFDGYSVDVLFRELASLYVGRMTNGARTLPVVAAHQSDFSTWQHRSIRAGHFGEAISFWIDRWRTLPSDLVKHEELPGAVALPHGPDQRIRTQVLPLSGEDAVNVRRLASTLRCTPYVLFRALMAVTLYQWTGRPRLAFWANFANRRSSALLRTIGWCANTHAVAVALDDNVSFSEVCSRVQQALLDTQQREMVPLPSIWPIRPQLAQCQTRVNFDLAIMNTWQEREWIFQRIPVPGGRQWVDLDVRLLDACGRFALLVSHNTGRYTAASVTTLHQTLQRLLDTFYARATLRLQEARRSCS